MAEQNFIQTVHDTPLDMSWDSEMVTNWGSNKMSNGIIHQILKYREGYI